MPGNPRTFADWFETASGFSPYRYQATLAQRPTPSVLEIPTGSGKTQAVLGAWMYQRLVEGRGPRRLVYALPMRTLVEQTRDVALAMRERTGEDEATLPIHVLMGGEDPHENDWRRTPEASQILIGTIDMLLSRALNRGYGESRFSWPVSFGLLSSDCRWVFDEVQLMGPARATSAQLDGLRTALGTALPCETMWVSATIDSAALLTADRPRLGEAMTLPRADRTGPLKSRLTAPKTLDRVDLSAAGPADLPREIASLAAERHQPGSRTIVVLNTVERAQAVFAALRRELTGGGPDLVLLHSRFRPADRRAHMDRVLEDPDERGALVVSTQVIEAGVDLSSHTLITETAPFSSIVQRVGRCNRTGEDRDARVLWLDRGGVDEGGDPTEAAPYLPADLNQARDALLKLAGSSLSPEALAGLDVPETPDDPNVLRRRDLVDLFDTSPDLSGMDVDIAPFIREDEERSVLVCFREIDENGAPADEGAPDREEIVQVPRADLRDRRCWKADHVNRSWERTPGRAVPPGSTVIVDAAEGGYTPEIGWDRRSRSKVSVIDLPGERRHGKPETFDDDDRGGAPQELLEHLARAKAEATELAGKLGLPDWSEAIAAAAALHDVGKAHPAFQRMLRTAMGIADGTDEGRLWAKSGTNGGERERRHLRHELASALTVRSLNGAVALPTDRNLIAYLVAAHHGRVRLSIRPAPGELQPEAGGGRRFALGLIDGDPIPAVDTPLGSVPATTIDLSCMELGAEDSWTNAAAGLRDSPDLGPFRLAFLEAVLRVADWRASA